EVDRVGSPRVFGLFVGVVVGHSRARVVYDVLQDRAEALGRRVDLRLRLLVDADGLGVAPSLEVENASVAPAVLVVTDQAPGWIGGERRLACAAEAEEEGHIVPRLIRVRRAVHWKHALGR